MTTPDWIFLGYLGLISLISVVVCRYDKIAAKRLPRHRTREATLLLLSALGGSVAMLVTMKIIRHKTKHVKFMLGIPVIILLQAAGLTAVYFLFMH
jgi:uncharacterized membrane protein YsdA (DUF1294 family)